jgi:ArsR family transcriptional regulator
LSGGAVLDLFQYFDEYQSIRVRLSLRRLGYTGICMDQKELARISKALSDPTRLRIFEGLSSHKEMFCGQVVEKYGLTPGTISHHLKILADANLIETRREGQFVYMRSRPETIRDYGRALAKMAGKK